MNNVKLKTKHYFCAKNKRFQAKQLRLAISRKDKKRKRNQEQIRKYFQKKISIQIANEKMNLEKVRKNILIEEHKKIDFKEGVENVKIVNGFGLEKSNINDFIEYCSKLIDINKKRLKIDIKDCTKMWPSAVMMLCSLVEWHEFGKKHGCQTPKIVSTFSKEDKVNSYLFSSGFFNFIKKDKDKDKKIITNHPSYFIPIKREYSKEDKVISEKEDDIIDLLQKNTNYEKHEIKSFVSNTILEVFQNIMEHGIVVNDCGWWFLSQYHKKHNFISINIADNGIGFKKSLLTGPQQEEIQLAVKSDKDGDFLKYVMQENVSGALDATCKIGKGPFGLGKGHYESGSRRGNGLDRIKNNCKNLHVSFSILSHYGYIFYNDEGKVLDYGTKDNRIFAGTLYHFEFPEKRREVI